MKKDTVQLLGFSLLTVVLLVACFGLVSLSHNVMVQYLLGWVGVAGMALYFRWLLRKKVKPTAVDEKGKWPPRIT